MWLLSVEIASNGRLADGRGQALVSQVPSRSEGLGARRSGDR
ncbi:hypothetical protein SynBIOSE41_03779 [Synechococcus sp. BIOS-E4-1]|nr:hypothetical protein SynBIOSE41_03779 [Synechococcus sp. BIOS-E4-1]